MTFPILVLCFIAASLSGTLHAGHDGSEQALQAIRHFVVLNRDKFDPQDVKNLLHGPDWYIRRYADLLTDPKSPFTLNDVKKLIGETFLWRASQNLNNWEPEDFPCEFWLAGFMQLTHDRNGELVLGTDLRPLGAYSGGLNAHWYTSHHFQLDYVDRLAGNNGSHWKILHNFSGVSLYNLADLREIINHFAPFVDRYPGTLDGNYVMDLPAIVETALRVVLSLLSPRSRDTFKFIQDKERFFLVKKRDMPEHFGGRLPVSRGLMMAQFPKLLTDCVPLRVMARQKGWSTESVKQFLDNTKHIVQYNAEQLQFRKRL